MNIITIGSLNLCHRADRNYGFAKIKIDKRKEWIKRRKRGRKYGYLRIVPIECMKLVLYIKESLQSKKKQKRKIQKL